MKISFIVGAVALLLMAGGWCWYALGISDEALANQGKCSQTARIKAIDATRRIFGRKTSTEMDADMMKQYSEQYPNPLQAGAIFSCAD